jgi:hypothetical protein
MAAGATAFVLKVVVIVLAIIGGIAVLAAVGMAAMHFGIMGAQRVIGFQTADVFLISLDHALPR